MEGDGLLTALWGRLFRTHEPSNSVVPGVLDAAGFERQLVRERACADRRECVFTLVTFAPTGLGRNGDRSDRALETLARTLLDRIRVSDIVGWRESPDCLGVILPATAAAGATRLVQEIETRFRMKLRSENFAVDPALDLGCKIFTYPGDVGEASERVEREQARAERP